MASRLRDCYEVLGVPRDADRKTIRDAFRRLALQYHPDRNREPGAGERFKEVAEAYAVLSDPDRRARYDAGGLPGRGGLSPEDLFAGLQFGDLFGGLGFDLGADLFDRLFRGQAAAPPGGADLEMTLEVPLERVLRGGEEELRVRRPAECGACGGSGAGSPPRRCVSCGGTGRRVTSRREGAVLVQQLSTCTDCGGRGSIVERPCPECGGLGRVDREERLMVRVPAGVEEGTVLRIRGHGLPGPVAGGPPGDLHVAVRSRPDPRFERRGADLLRRETIPVSAAVLGTELTVPGIEGAHTVVVPAGTQPGTVLRVVHGGLPAFGDRRHGDLLVSIGVQVPVELDREERRLYERLRGLEAEAAGRSRT